MYVNALVRVAHLASSGHSMVPNNQVDKENGAISQDSAWGGLVKKRLQPLLNLINKPINSRIHPLSDHSVYKNYDRHKGDKCQDLHQRPLSLAG